jgi:hypothetical protein
MILILVPVALGALGYGLIRGDHDAPAAAPSAGGSPPATADRARESELQREMARAILSQRESRADANTDVTGRLAELEARLASVENQRKDGGESKRAEKARTDAGYITEAEFGQWMDDALAAGALDRTWADQVKGQFHEILKTVPGVSLDGVECGDRFCRASFSSADGARPNLLRLYGSPPLTTDAFTVDLPDGSVAIYVTRAGESLTGLRGEATGIPLAMQGQPMGP